MRDKGDLHRTTGVMRSRGVRTVRVEADLLAKNDRIAAANREWFVRWELLALNLVSSPGAGKTTLLERTLRDVAGAWPCVVIEGDQQTIMKKQNGVVIKLTSTTQGASLKLAASGVRLTLEKYKPMQVGPLANVLVGYAQGHALTRKWTDDALGRVSKLAGRPVGIDRMQSTMGRYLSRATRSAMLAELL